MRLRNALRIAIANYALIIKNLIYKLVIFAIFSLSLGLILKLALRPFIDMLRPVFISLQEVIKAIVNGENHMETISNLKFHFNGFKEYLSNNVGSLVWLVVIIILFGIIYRFLMSALTQFSKRPEFIYKPLMV